MCNRYFIFSKHQTLLQHQSATGAPDQFQQTLIIKHQTNNKIITHTPQMQKQPHTSNTQPTHVHHAHLHPHEQEYQNEQDEQQYVEEGRESQVAHWKLKEQRKKYRKQIFGEHYNYNYRRPNQHKMYRIQENRNTEIERSNRILLEKIQSIFKRSMGRKRIQQINTSEAASMSEITNKTSQMAVQSQPHSTSNITTVQKRSIEEQLQRKMLNRPQKRSANEVNKIGSISKNIALAKNELNCSHTHDIVNSRQVLPNKKHIKLEQLDGQAFSRRKRIQTQISKPVQKNNMDKNQGGRRESLENNQETDDYYNPKVHNNKKTSRKTITSNEHHSPEANHKNVEYHNNKETNRPSSSKIILHKSTITLNNQPYRIELYVKSSTYIISSYCFKNGREYHELITMPYKHYQQLYKAILNQCHENIYQYLFVNPVNGLLQVSGFESKFMDIFEYGEIELNEVSPMYREKPQPNQKQIQKNSRASEEMSGVIVHFNNNNMNVDDTFDRITIANSEFKNQQGRDLSSTPGPLTEHHEQQNKKASAAQKQTQQNTSHKKQAIVMTDPILPQLKSTSPELQESRVDPLDSSQIQSRLVRKQQKFTSNLISLQIQPIKQTMEKSEVKMEKKDVSELNQYTQDQRPNRGQGIQVENNSIDIGSGGHKNKSVVGNKKIYQPYQQQQYENMEIIEDNP